MKRKHLLRAVIAALLMVQFFASALPVAAGGARDVLSLSPPLITFIATEFQAFDGTTEITDLSSIPQDADIKLSYAFRVEDAYDPADDVAAGDFFEVALPTQLTAIANFPLATDIPMTFTSGGSTYTIAKLSILVGGVVRITFQPDVELFSEVPLSFSIEGSLDSKAIDDGTTLTFLLVAGGSVYTIGFESEEPPAPPPSAIIGKGGSYSASKNEITWTVTVNSGDPSITISDVYVVDTLGPNQTYKPGSSSISEPVYSASDGTYTFFLSSVTGTTSFTYKTTPTDSAFGTEGSSKTITNRADLYIGEVVGDPVSSAQKGITVTTDWISKSGSRREKDGVYYIDWTIKLNNNNRVVPAGASFVLTDSMPQYLVLDTTSVKRNSLAPPVGDSFSFVGGVLTYTFGTTAPITGQQIITFTTAVHSDYYKQQNVTGFRNTGVLTYGGGSYSVQSGNVGVPTSLLLKSGQSYDAATQRITWRMQVNSNGVAIGGATISDTIGSGYTFAEDFGIRLNGSDTSITRVATLAELTSAPNQYYYASGELKIYLGDLGAGDKPVVRFQTVVLNPSHTAVNDSVEYKNRATLTGTGITTATSEGSQWVTSQVLSKENKGYDYSERTLLWEITVNQNKMAMTNAQVVDMIQPGQAYVPGSLLIDGLAPASGVMSLNESTGLLELDLGDISGKTVSITLTTVVTDVGIFLRTKGSVTFENRVTLDSGIVGAPVISEKAEKEVTNTAIDKSLFEEYTVANGYIGWEVYINANQVELENAVLMDRLEEGLELDVTSVILYPWSQDADGVRTLGDAVLAEDYSIEYDYNTRVFLIHLPDGPQGYCLRFRTDVNAAGRYSNTISFTGSYTTSDSASSDRRVSAYNIAVSTSGTNGSITVIKVDQNGDPITTGAVFELLDHLGNVKATLATDENGEAYFGMLKLRTYYIREKMSPTGYARKDDWIMVTLTSADSESRHQIISFGNLPLKASILLKKTDALGVGLAGGLFSIYDASDTEFLTALQTVESEEDGLITFSGLKAGSYNIREVKPPKGYFGTDEVRSVTLTLDEETNTLADVTVKEAFVNQPLPKVLPATGSFLDMTVLLIISGLLAAAGLVFAAVRRMRARRPAAGGAKTKGPSHSWTQSLAKYVPALLITLGLLLTATAVGMKWYAYARQGAMVNAYSDALALSAGNGDEQAARTPGTSTDYAPQTGEIRTAEDGNGGAVMPVGLLTIPKIDLQVAVAEGVDSRTLCYAVGHFAGAALPGEVGNFSVAGHRSYALGEFFNRLDEVEIGDSVIAERGGIKYNYIVTQILVVGPEDTWVLEQTPDAQITLITCTPSRIATHRLVVKGVLAI